MIVSENKIRIRYDEVDKMGYVYHGNYAKYFHISRTELLRKVGICDRSLENYNILLPVVDLSIKYLHPIFYDEIIIIKTSLHGIPTSRMKFQHEVLNEKNEIINKAESTVAFVDVNTRRPLKAPQIIVDRIKHYINTQN
jgi:acyl-CoA thioester hydrolase